jgi:uncharacterized protein
MPPFLRMPGLCPDVFGRARKRAAFGHTVRMDAGAMKVFWMISGVAALCAGIVGLFLPLLPTVPFVLLAAYCFSRGNKRWERWMLSHPRLGPIIAQWRQHHVVPLKAKQLATVMMTISSVGAWLLMPAAYGWIPALICSLVAAWLWRLPHQIPGASQTEQTQPAAGDLAGVVAAHRDWFAFGVIALIMLSHALPYAWATVTLDTARDLAAAQRIITDEAVLRGPVFNGLFHLGPIWFYLLAPVLALTKSQALSLFWAGLLAASKFPIAYTLGRSIRDADLGLCLAVLMALPGWASMGSVFPTHTVMVEATVLLQLLLMLRLAQGAKRSNWAWLGLAAGLALHAHPSAVFVLMFLPAVFWARRRILSWREWLHMLLGVVLFALPLLPMLVAEYREAWPALAPTLAFARDGGGDAGGFAAILSGTFIAGPAVALGMIDTAAWSMGASVLIAALASAGFLGNVSEHARTERWFLASALIALILLSLILAIARHYTPFYMTLVLIPFGCIAIAIGMRCLPKPRVWILAALALSIWGNAMTILVAESGHAHINVARLSNVQNRIPKLVDAALLPAWQLDALGQMFCDSPDHIVLHGYLSLLYDASLALGPDLRCRKANATAFSGKGSAASTHWLGLPPSLATTLGLQQGQSWSDTPKQDVQPLWPRRALQPADRLHYPHHRASGEAGIEHRWNVRSRPGSILITTDLLYPYRVNHVAAVFADLQPARLLATTNLTQVWICDHCSGSSIAWEVRGTSNDPDVLDIVAIGLPMKDRQRHR